MSGISLPIISKFDPTGIRKAEGALGGFKSSVGKLGGIIAGAFSVAAVTNFVKTSVNAASDLSESLNAVTVSYGDASESIIKLGETAAQRLGVTQTAFNESAVRFSAFAERVVGSGGDVTGFVDDITTRASDFASVFNIDVSEALQVFQSGLSGEAEPLKRFGINLLDSEVKAYALRSGIIGVGETMTEQEKVQARYGLLMESTAKTAGDFANTSDGLANSQRILEATFTDMQATIGAALLPAFAEIVQSLVPILDEIMPTLEQAFKDLTPAITAVAQTIPPLLTSIAPLVPIFAQIVTLLAEQLVQIMPLVVTLFESFIPIIEDLLAAVVPIIEQAFPILVELIGAVIEMLLPLIEGILPIFITLWDTLAPIVMEFIDAFMPILIELLPLLTTMLELVVIPALQMLADMLAITLPAAFDLFQALGLAPNLESMGGWADAVGDIVFNVRTFIAETMNSVIGSLEGATNAAIEMVNNLLNAGRKLPGAAGKLFQKIDPLGSVSFERVALPGKFDNLRFPTVDTSGISDVSTRRINNTVATISSAYEQAWLSTQLSRSGLNSSAGQRGFYTDLFGNSIFGNIPAMARGGVVTGPTLALIGEAGPEAVIPLSQAGKMGATYNITVQAGVGDPVTIGREVVTAIKRYERANGPVFASA